MKPFKPTITSSSTLSSSVYIIRLQYIPTSSNLGFLNRKLNSFSLAFKEGTMSISKIVKFRAPYIDVKTTNTLFSDISGSINTSGSVLSIIGINNHEQYITSQFLEGSGVGVLIPDQYDPKLREQLPDIINKTGIDVNSLTQGSN